MFKNILMPTDGSEHSEKAIERGIALAKLCGARVTGIHVLPHYMQRGAFEDYTYPDRFAQEQLEGDDHAQAEDFLEFVRKTALLADVQCEAVVATNDSPYDAIVSAANEHNCDLIIMTSRFRQGLVSLIMSSETERVLHRTSIPVLIFRALVSAEHRDKMPQIEQIAGERGQLVGRNQGNTAIAHNEFEQQVSDSEPRNQDVIAETAATIRRLPKSLQGSTE